MIYPARLAAAPVCDAAIAPIEARTQQHGLPPNNSGVARLVTFIVSPGDDVAHCSYLGTV